MATGRWQTGTARREARCRVLARGQRACRGVRAAGRADPRLGRGAGNDVLRARPLSSSRRPGQSRGMLSDAHRRGTARHRAADVPAFRPAAARAAALQRADGRATRGPGRNRRRRARAARLCSGQGCAVLHGALRLLGTARHPPRLCLRAHRRAGARARQPAAERPARVDARRDRQPVHLPPGCGAARAEDAGGRARAWRCSSISTCTAPTRSG